MTAATNRRAHDARPNIVHLCDTETKLDRSLFVPGTYIEPGKPHRLRVLYDEEHGLTDLLDERTTSEAPTAQGFDNEGLCITFTDEQVRWLHEQLGALIARWDEGSLR